MPEFRHGAIQAIEHRAGIVGGIRCDRGILGIEGLVPHAAAAFIGQTAPGMIDETLAHLGGHQAKERFATVGDPRACR